MSATETVSQANVKSAIYRDIFFFVSEIILKEIYENCEISHYREKLMEREDPAL